MPSLAADVVPESPAPAREHHAWIVAFDPQRSREAGSSAPLLFHVDTGRVGSSLLRAEDDRLIVLFAGVLLNGAELAGAGNRGSASETVLAVVRREGVGGLGRLRGPFAVFVYEPHAHRLTVARDHVGQQPLYAARIGERWLFSGSPVALAAQPGVGAAPDAVALSEYLCGWYPAVESSGYRGIDRVAPATRLTIDRRAVTSQRYWDPSPDDRAIEWLDERGLDRFDEVFTQAVERCTRGSAAAVFLSGGVDSIAVAAAATDVLRRREASTPYALSLAFPDGAANEEAVQTGVARGLDLAQSIVPFDNAIGRAGLIPRALEMAGAWPVPMWNIWAPAYEHLAQLGVRHGRRTILTGRGGDEWLTVTPYLAADLLRRGDVAGLCRVLQMRQRSLGLDGLRASARLFWLTAGRPLASAALDTVAPRAWHRRRRERLLAERPDWVAPDPAVRHAMDERIDGWMAPARPAQGFYVREMRTALLHPAVTQDLEETQEFGRRLGVQMLHPFWDVDLIELLYRTPPHLLMHDGQSKWLLRRRLAQRLPGLGLERRGKVSARGVFRGIMRQQTAAAWDRLGGVRGLVDIGVVKATGVQSALPALLGVGSASHTGRIWQLLTLETWVRQRFGVGSKGEA
jgi:asparagine synthase (glutamine-hydrolysing)